MTYFSLIIDYGMYLKCLQKPRCLGWFKTSQALLSAVHKTRLNSSKDNFIAKSFRLPTKRKLSILSNFLFLFVSFIGVFSILKCKTLVLKTTTSWTRQPFCWWMTFTKVSNPFLPSPPKWLTWPLDVCGGVAYGWFYWFSLYWKNFFPNLSGFRNFFPNIWRCKIFFQHCTSWAIFFSVQDISLPGIICILFSSRSQTARHFF